MTVAVFSGPTLGVHEIAAEIVDATVLPPVSQGDVYRAALRRPQAIGIIDGYFERVPSVWHKEILWAMSQGIRVFGAASMGALRAAELADFGMTGTGAIFESYRDGSLEDDDEVAIAHAGEDHAYRPASEAMVNIRATLQAAAAAGVLSPSGASTLERIAKGLFYPERDYPRLIELAGGRAPGGELEAFTRWLPQGRVNQKREDALAMLRAIRTALAGGSPAAPVSFSFEYTIHWRELHRSASETTSAHPEEDARVLVELQRNPDLFERASTAALALLLAEEKAQRASHAPEAFLLLQHADEFCRKHALPAKEDIAGWLERNCADQAGMERLIEARACLNWAGRTAGGGVEPWILLYLRWTGDYERLLCRAGQPSP